MTAPIAPETHVLLAPRGDLSSTVAASAASSTFSGLLAARAVRGMDTRDAQGAPAAMAFDRGTLFGTAIAARPDDAAARNFATPQDEPSRVGRAETPAAISGGRPADFRSIRSDFGSPVTAADSRPLEYTSFGNDGFAVQTELSAISPADGPFPPVVRPSPSIAAPVDPGTPSSAFRPMSMKAGIRMQVTRTLAWPLMGARAARVARLGPVQIFVYLARRGVEISARISGLGATEEDRLERELRDEVSAAGGELSVLRVNGSSRVVKEG